jgi:hypothetical protein
MQVSAGIVVHTAARLEKKILLVMTMAAES